MRAVSTAAVAGLLLLWSVTTLFIDHFGTPYRRIAEHLESGAAPDSNYFAKLEQSFDASGAIAKCPRELLRSAVTIGLARLHASIRDGASSTANALSEAVGIVKAGLRCFPHDGNLWLRLAMLEFARDGLTGAVERMLALSAKAAPHEGWVLAPRIVFAAKVLDNASPGILELLKVDIRAFVEEARPSDIAALYFNVGEDAQRMFDTSLASLENKRQVVLKEAIEAATPNLPPERRP